VNVNKKYENNFFVLTTDHIEALKKLPLLLNPAIEK
jgi:hypothetical protein